jgi:hypothetical protein
MKKPKAKDEKDQQKLESLRLELEESLKRTKEIQIEMISIMDWGVEEYES